VVRLARAALAGQRGLSLTAFRKAHGFALGSEAGYLLRDIVTDCPGANRPSELATTRGDDPEEQLG